MTTENEVDVKAETSGKMATVVSVKFTYTDGGRWHSIDVTCAELLSILQTGKIDGKQICAVEVFTVTNEDEEKIAFVYDFVLDRTSHNPWRIV